MKNIFLGLGVMVITGQVYADINIRDLNITIPPHGTVTEAELNRTLSSPPLDKISDNNSSYTYVGSGVNFKITEPGFYLIENSVSTSLVYAKDLVGCWYGTSSTNSNSHYGNKICNGNVKATSEHGSPGVGKIYMLNK